MLNNYIGGGQVFLHKIRMFMQVFWQSITVALLIGNMVGILIFTPKLMKQDLAAAFSYQKAKWADDFDEAVNPVRANVLGKKKEHITYVNANIRQGVYGKEMDPRKVMRILVFKNAYGSVTAIIVDMIKYAIAIIFAAFVLIFVAWWKFGKSITSDQTLTGGGVLLTTDQVKRKLKSLGKCSDFSIGKMPLVKDMETRHFLVTGATGSGKTNLIHNLLPQVERKKQPVIVIDQTGEMIAKYYNRERGDIIFNPFDARSHGWDFWADCSKNEELERFSKILIGFNRKQSGAHSDPFWENAAETVFNACVEHLRPSNASIETIGNMVCYSDLHDLKILLIGTQASRYLSDDSKQTASSILSVLAANAKPLTYLKNISNDQPIFSMKEHFAGIQNGSDAWLFLATKPSARALTLPLIACLTELALSSLMEIGIDEKRRVWIIIDEFASLGKLPALSPLMAEGRKYGACVLAGMQSLNQLYEQYGHYGGSTIFGQFGTSFFFRNTEHAVAKMFSTLCGRQTILHRQKNISLGANEFRDGVSYTEQQQSKSLVESEDLGSLALGQCYVLLPEPKVRLSKVQTDESHVKAKCEGFVEAKSEILNDQEQKNSSQPDSKLSQANTELLTDLNENTPKIPIASPSKSKKEYGFS